MAYRALTDDTPPNRDYVLVGPELLSHDEAAAVFTEVLGRPIRHVRISEEQVAQRFTKYGIPESYARRIAGGEARASRGEFAVLNDVVAEVTGRAGLDLRRFVEKHRQVWQA